MKNALKVLAFTTIPANYDEIAYWIARTLAHFPRRDSAKDGVVISDLSGVAVKKGVSLCAAVHVLESIWQEANEENPWFPVTGQILQDMVEKTKSYALQIDRLQNPKVALPPPQKPAEQPDKYGGRKWPDWTENERAAFLEEIRPYMPSIKRIMKNLYDVPENDQTCFTENESL